MKKELREFRRLERVCLEQAALSTMDLARSGLLKVADDCRIAIEAQAPRGAFAGAVQALKLALSATGMSNRH
ncbi:hypothetical protein HAP41_0000025020 [Bradyrhizobium barranii subsp. apii]|uniref:Uncharacterized protein n=1 Tax=Bradyrhizobium barranii subsp. apii TaxID=2819348 RepID=A0A8T5VKV6_9BRAD|nr:hypothetical protein [Bradyrhizobium barranii]UPT83692.1 hypothetical protein HAP41_0000025020 [Bradyrhizobium barranii subsp. apii]